MKMKTLTLTCGAALLGMSFMAQAGLEANIGVTSNYLWRGVTQTSNGPAVSGGIDWSHDSGFYVGTWASNIDWGVGNGAEVDFYGGFANEIGDFGYDLGLIYYYYPATGYEDSDFIELTASGSWSVLEVGLAYTLNGQADSDGPWSDGDIYFWGSLSFDVAESWSIGATVGHYNFDTTSAWERANGGDVDYTHGQIDVGKSAGDWGDFTFTLSKAQKESGDDDTKFVVSWAKSF